MDLGLAINYIFPDAMPVEHFVISTDEEGKQYVSRWNLNEEIPTQEELEQAWFNFLKENQIAKMQEICNKKIEKGFYSESTGFEFEFEVHDQTNFTQQAIILMSDNTIENVTWKTLNKGIQLINREDFFKILKESEAHKRTYIGKFWTLRERISRATTEEEILSITWEEEKPIEEIPIEETVEETMENPIEEENNDVV